MESCSHHPPPDIPTVTVPPPPHRKFAFSSHYFLPSHVSFLISPPLLPLCILTAPSHPHPQHYLKVHAPRTLVCPECQTAAFASEPLLRAHRRLCGASYQCGCGARYTSVRTLRSHAAKHGHTTLLAVRWVRRGHVV